MPDVNPTWSSFNAGELSPLMDGRTDQEKYFSGCKLLENFIPTVQGPVVRRAGTRYVGTTKNNGEAFFMTFEYSLEQSYALEIGDLYVRFWVNRGQLLSGGLPYEIVAPWPLADLKTVDDSFALRAVQAGEDMWIVHQGGTYPPQKLTRLGATSWTLADVPFRYGPFADVDPDSEITVTASAKTGSVTLTADASLFRASDVGATFYMELEKPDDIDPWEPDQNLGAVGSEVRYEGNFYELTNKNTYTKSGFTPPTALYGTVRDGKYSLAYLHSGYGMVRITSFTDDMHVTGDVITDTVVGTQLPDQLVTAGTKRHARAVFNDDDGWPTNVVFFRDRLFYVRNRKLVGSFVRRFDDFSKYDGPDVTKETALQLDIAVDRADAIRWASPTKALLLGSARGEIAVKEQTPQSVFAADNAFTDPQTDYGSRYLEPLRVGEAVLFVQRAGRTLREMKYSYEIDRYVADDVTVLAEHILDAGVVDMDFAQEPNNLVWCALTDGTLAALTYDRKRGVVCWSRHLLNGGAARALACVSSPDARRDDLWLIVEREVAGATVRYVEYMEDPRLVEDDVNAGFYVDCGLTYTGPLTDTITGLSHLEGETVDVLADGSPHAACVVSGGTITLTRQAQVVHVGMNMVSRLQTMRLEAGAQNGSAQTTAKSISEVWLRLLNTIGGSVGPDFDTLDDLPGLDPTLPVGTPPSLVNGDVQMVMPADFGTDGYICVQQAQPLPMTLVSLTARASVND
jgi:hypothetical protein